jgi:hypothetical protein
LFKLMRTGPTIDRRARTWVALLACVLTLAVGLIGPALRHHNLGGTYRIDNSVVRTGRHLNVQPAESAPDSQVAELARIPLPLVDAPAPPPIARATKLERRPVRAVPLAAFLHRRIAPQKSDPEPLA